MSDETIRLSQDCVLDLGRGVLLRNEEPVHLRPQTFAVLRYLTQAQGRLISKDQLIEDLWLGRAVTDGALGKCIEEIRQALGLESSKCLKTVHGRGYRLERGCDASFDGTGAVSKAGTEDLPPIGWQKWRGLFVGGGLTFVIALLGLVYLASLAENPTLPPADSDLLESVAVLPFKPLLPGARDEALEMGMADTLITQLSAAGDMIVRPISASRKYHGLELDPVRAGQELVVDAVLDGSILRDGERIRITARLIRVADGRQLWSDRFDEDFHDIFSVQDAIAERVVGELAQKLRGNRGPSPRKRRAVDPETLEQYLWGRFYWNKATFEDYRRSLGHFQKAVELDPGFGAAYSGIADFYGFAVSQGRLPPDECWPLMEDATLKALELDPDLAEAYNSLAGLRLYRDRDWKGGLESFKRAVELNPSYAEVHNHMGSFSWLLKWEERTIAEFTHVLVLDPFSVRYNRNLGWALYLLGRDEESLKQFSKTLQLDSNDALTFELQAQVYERLGQEVAAARSFLRALTLQGDRELAALFESVYQQAGYAPAIKAVFAKQVERLQAKLSQGEYVAAMHFARAYARAGDRESALAWLERAYHERNRLVLEILVDPLFDGLRSDPRFKTVIERLNLSPDSIEDRLPPPSLSSPVRTSD
ncbi:MAG TPA: winged helix-turn-helix domain-containing protein [Acidobacteriota bacterium]|nr:winged helix-turn-helix domain-containing protein [Acidobacteriota bacterium]